ncbi:thiamine phosphate synthase [Pontiellaceae bacterium B12227]|nr:thiamine phosphate synthase [Pontiellaceae bacterium B12227]
MNELFGLYLILTNPVAGYEKAAEAAAHEGVRYLQLRMKNASPQEHLAMAIKLRKITAGSETQFIVNDDLQVAIDSDADGIHLGQNDCTLPMARKKWNCPGKLYGLSTHSMEQASKAQELQPDYIGIGPVFPTPTKADTAPAIGIAEAGRIASTTPLTSVVIGGVDEQNLPGLLEAGAMNYCVVRAVNSSPDPASAIRRLQDIWKTHAF